MRVRTVVNFLACLLFIYIFFVYMAHRFLKYIYLSIYLSITVGFAALTSYLLVALGFLFGFFFEKF